jgi:hypothetical protein
MQHEAHERPRQAAGDHTAPSLGRTAFSATVHCLTGCVIGEVLGMVQTHDSKPFRYSDIFPLQRAIIERMSET